jgi:CBS-domain-containing membrane protein
MTMTVIDRLRSLRVADAMSSQVVSLRADQSLAEAVEVLAGRGVAAAPVTDESGRCVGVFSLADLLKSQESAGRLSFPSHAKVADLMTPKVHSTTTDASLLAAASLMNDKHVHRLPVLDSSGQVRGVLSTMDVVAALLHAAEESDVALLKEIRRERGEIRP